MELSEFTLRLLLLFIPGLIAAYLFDALTSGPRKDRFNFLLRALFFGLFSNFLYWLLVKVIYFRTPNIERPQVRFLLALTDSSLPIPYREIFFVCVLAMLIGSCATYAYTYRWFYRLTLSLGMSKKFGESDVWSFAFNSGETTWVTVRDHVNGLTFDGWAEAFSEGSDRFELLLRDVSVYNLQDGVKLYDVGATYLSRERSNATIEFRAVPMRGSVIHEVSAEVHNDEPKHLERKSSPPVAKKSSKRRRK